MLPRRPAVRDLAMTTNGVMLAGQASALREAGLHRVTVSLDTLGPDRFRALTRRDDHASVLAGHRGRAAAGFSGLKLDTVVIRGVNEDELSTSSSSPAVSAPRCASSSTWTWAGRPIGRATQVVSRAEMLALADRYGSVEPIREESSAPAERFRLPDGTTFGIIASTTTPFCRTCDRSRLTADGTWYLCLYAQRGMDLRTPLRDGASRDELRALIASGWSRRRDRGAEERKELEAIGRRAS